ncbi:hypothetical protein RNZ50_02980 [Paracoccaceae bacterium Fryx2]|nr:hypothetical protein [Paracoccaceae bacterium Fryx2]
MKGTRAVWAVVIAISVAQFAVTYLAPIQAIPGTEAVPLADGPLIVAIVACFLAIIDIEKADQAGASEN